MIFKEKMCKKKCNQLYKCLLDEDDRYHNMIYEKLNKVIEYFNLYNI